MLPKRTVTALPKVSGHDAQNGNIQLER